MQQAELTSEYFIGETKKELDILLGMKYGDDILGAKAIEAGIKLSTQLCILRLRQLGMSFGQISRAEGIQVSADAVNASNAKIVSIGPVTSEKLRQLNSKVDLQAAEHTIEGLIEAIENADT